MNSLENEFTDALLALCDTRAKHHYLDVSSVLREIELKGAVTAVKASLLNSRAEEHLGGIVARGRPDLTFEALALRTAWKGIFDDAQVSIARKRLAAVQQSFVHDQEIGLIPRSCRGERIIWVDGLPIATWPDFTVEWNPSNPLAPQPHRSACDDIQASYCELRTMGCVPQSSLAARIHLSQCRECTRICIDLIPVYDHLNSLELYRLQAIVNLAATCIEIWGQMDPLAFWEREAASWRAIVLVSGIGYLLDDVEPWIEAEARPSDDLIRGFVTNLGPRGYDVLKLAPLVDLILQDLEGGQQDLSTGNPFSFPSWSNDLQSVPGVFDAIPCRTWDAAMELLGPRPEFIGGWGREHFSSSGFLQFLLSSIGRKSPSVDALAPTYRQDHEIVGDLPRHEDQIDQLLGALAEKDRLNRGEDLLRRAAGDVVYRSLCAQAKVSAINGELLLDTATVVEFSPIVIAFAKSIEHQIRHLILEPFCEDLIAQGVKFYPSDAGTPGRPLLIKNGRTTERLNFGEIKRQIEWPPPELIAFLDRLRIDRQQVLAVLTRMLPQRNNAAHMCEFTYPMAKEFRDACVGSRGLFALLLPTVS